MKRKKKLECRTEFQYQNILNGFNAAYIRYLPEFNVQWVA